MTDLALSLIDELIRVAQSYGFRKQSETFYVRADGAAVMFGLAGDFAFRRPDGSYGNCRAQAMCTYYRKYPLPYAIEILTREFSQPAEE